MSKFPIFDVQQIDLKSLAERGHRLHVSACAQPTLNDDVDIKPECSILSKAIVAARERGAPVVLFMGGHTIKLGLARYLSDLIERGLVTHVASNGSAVIHDFELAMVGATSEDVAKWIAAGQFGLWRETSRLNEIIKEGAQRGEGLGEAVGRAIEDNELPHHDLSVFGACYRANIPFTVHVSIGCDIIHMMPNCDGRSLGQATYTDFLIFAETIRRLEGGVFINLGTAIAGPEVFLKALSMARNVARQQGEKITTFVTAVFDLVELPDNFADGPPGPEHPLYYFRPWKTLLCRTVAGEGESLYLHGDFKQTVPALWQSLVRSI